MKDWESTFQSWAQGPGKTEEERCENAIRAIRDAINSSDTLKTRGVEVFLQGSYKNRVNVQQDSDVDVGVVCSSIFYTDYPEGTTDSTFNNVTSDYTYTQFKNEVEQALVDKFGREHITRANKSFDIKSNSYRVESDVAPFFEHRRYSADGKYITGVELKPDNGGSVINHPEQHYSNGVNKNTNCSRRYKRLVRILKKLSYEMEDNGISKAKGIPGFLCECLIYNVSNDHFGTDSYTNDLRNCLIYLYAKLGEKESDEWGEVSELKYLFRPSQKWTKSQARDFIAAVWNYVGYES